MNDNKRSKRSIKYTLTYHNKDLRPTMNVFCTEIMKGVWSFYIDFFDRDYNYLDLSCIGGRSLSFGNGKTDRIAEDYRMVLTVKFDFPVDGTFVVQGAKDNCQGVFYERSVYESMLDDVETIECTETVDNIV